MYEIKQMFPYLMIIVFFGLFFLGIRGGGNSDGGGRGSSRGSSRDGGRGSSRGGGRDHRDSGRNDR